MTAAARVTLSGLLSASPTGSRQIGPLDIISAAACGAVTEVVLQAGANTITVPTLPAPTACIVQLPSTNTSAVTLKGVTGDAGIATGKTGYFDLCLDPAALPANYC